MLIGARNAMMAGSGGWKNPYVTDGLVAMWDGEWNAGGGIHDPNATVWKDLIGDNDISISSSYQTIGEKGVVFNNATAGGRLTHAIGNMQALEFCGSVSKNSEHAIFSNKQTVGADESIYPCLWYCGGALGAGYQKKGYPLGVNTIATIYADYPEGGDVANFFAKSFNGVIKTPDGSSDFFRRAQSMGFSFRRDYTFSGTVYRLMAYSRVLTADEIAANYAVDKARFNLA